MRGGAVARLRNPIQGVIMTTITFDTLKYAKQDLEALRADLQRDMKELEHRLVARIYQALLVLTFALAGIVIALVKLL